MPYLKIQTNIKVENTDELLIKTSKHVAEIINKPVDYVMVAIEDNVKMCFSLNQDPCMFIEFKSLGLHEEQTNNLSEKVCSFFNSELGILKDRMYIEFKKNPRHMWGWDSKNMG
ncbi:MAG: phenylpyruvate tautomerase MIF-related protein [Hyphomicrobiales bacterium]